MRRGCQTKEAWRLEAIDKKRCHEQVKLQKAVKKKLREEEKVGRA
jgi:hypothetical protein